MDSEALVAKLGDYFRERDDVAFAYLFGSTVREQVHASSDVDIGVYFMPITATSEYESTTEYLGEETLWSDLEQITKRETDLVVLNRAPATLLFAVINEGRQIFSRDDELLGRLFTAVSTLAEDFRNFVSGFVLIKERSRSLTPLDQERLERLMDFLAGELTYCPEFIKVSQLQYQQNIALKRNFERWAENIVNASIDIAQILLASAKRPIPQTYRSILQELAFLPGFDAQLADSLANFAHLRNVLAHEYFDLRFSGLQKFAVIAEPVYASLVGFVKNLIKTEVIPKRV